MSQDGSLGYSIKKIFVWLFILTAIEVVWAIPEFIRESRLLLWSGLLICAYLKGFLIFMYFMHMKFEKMILKWLIIPTVPLVCVVVFALMPDVSFNGQRDYEVGHQLDETGKVVDVLDPARDSGHGDDDGDHDSGH